MSIWAAIGIAFGAAFLSNIVHGNTGDLRDAVVIVVVAAAIYFAGG